MSDVSNDGTDKLCHALYKRKAKATDYIGGIDARILYDGAARITELEAEIERLRHTLERSPPCWFYVEDSKKSMLQLAKDYWQWYHNARVKALKVSYDTKT